MWHPEALSFVKLRFHRSGVFTAICDNLVLTRFTNLALPQCLVTICLTIVTGRFRHHCLWQKAVTGQGSSQWSVTKIGHFTMICPVLSLFFVTDQLFSGLLWQSFGKLSQDDGKTMDLWHSARWLSQSGEDLTVCDRILSQAIRRLYLRMILHTMMAGMESYHTRGFNAKVLRQSEGRALSIWVFSGKPTREPAFFPSFLDWLSPVFSV